MPAKPLIERARALRAEEQRPEGLLWSKLRNRGLAGWKWRRQVPRGPYIVDFLCAELGLVVELDGGQHVDQADYDELRTAWLEASGLRVIRFWNHEVIEDIDAVCETILVACGGEAPHPPTDPSRGSVGPSLSPQAGRGPWNWKRPAVRR